MRVLLVIALTGCGRLAFDPLAADATSDGIMQIVCAAPVGHDEDVDGVDDACDGCPHIADAAQPDGDGDGVDDACDPNPTAARDRIVFFDPFTTRRAEWSFNTQMATFPGDTLEIDARNGLFSGSLSPRAATDDVYAISGRFLAGSPTNQRQVTLELDESGARYYYCELNGDTTGSYLAATYTPDGMSYTVIDSSLTTALMENAPFSLQFREIGSAYTCSTTWPVPNNSLSGPVPSYAVGYMSFAVQGVQASLDYMIQIHSD